MSNEKKEAEANMYAEVSETWYEMNGQLLFGVTAGQRQCHCTEVDEVH